MKAILPLSYFLGLLLIGLAALVLLGGCGYADKKDPKTYLESSEQAAYLAALLHARDIGGTINQNQCCGSMEPLIYKGDWIVTKPEPFTDDLKGKVVEYTRYNGQKLLHRLVSGSAARGFIASGDNNKRSEPDERVTSANYISTVIAIYRVDPNQ